MKYEQLHDGDWVTPVMKDYRLKCCDCGLVHVMNFRVRLKGFRLIIQFQAIRHKRATAAARRKKQVISR